MVSVSQRSGVTEALPGAWRRRTTWILYFTIGTCENDIVILIDYADNINIMAQGPDSVNDGSLCEPDFGVAPLLSLFNRLLLPGCVIQLRAPSPSLLPRTPATSLPPSPPSPKRTHMCFPSLPSSVSRLRSPISHRSFPVAHLLSPFSRLPSNI